jgi:DNA-binding response OmpR family regulator
VERLQQTLSPEAGIELVQWPRDESLRQSLARAGIPRLLVLERGAPPPDQLGFDEDWIREPFGPADLRSRLRRISESIIGQTAADPWIDHERVLHRGPRTTVLTASEAVVADALLASPGAVVSRAALESRLWPDGAPPSDRAVDAIVYRLRRRCRDLGLLIRVARGEGFVLLRSPI